MCGWQRERERGGHRKLARARNISAARRQTMELGETVTINGQPSGCNLFITLESTLSCRSISHSLSPSALSLVGNKCSLASSTLGISDSRRSLSLTMHTSAQPPPPSYTCDCLLFSYAVGVYLFILCLHLAKIFAFLFCSSPASINK